MDAPHSSWMSPSLLWSTHWPLDSQGLVLGRLWGLRLGPLGEDAGELLQQQLLRWAAGPTLSTPGKRGHWAVTATDATMGVPTQVGRQRLQRGALVLSERACRGKAVGEGQHRAVQRGRLVGAQAHRAARHLQSLGVATRQEAGLQGLENLQAEVAHLFVQRLGALRTLLERVPLHLHGLGRETV